MIISGLQKTTLLDFPGHVAATIFTSGCNMRCPFCHNMNLVAGSDAHAAYSEAEILKFLKKRQGILEGVCITGGEPTLQKDLIPFITSIKSLGYKVKLDTNGTNPSIISQLISLSLVDYVAMDIKSSLSDYPRVCGIDNFDVSPISDSIDLLKNSAIPYEFRTTVIANFHNSSIMEDIGKLLKGSMAYYLQPFVDSEFVPNHELTSPNDEELIAYRKQLLNYISKVEVRGKTI